MKNIRKILLTSGLVSLASTALIAEMRFQGMGFLPNISEVNPQPHMDVKAVSGDGKTVVGSASNPHKTAFKWTQETGMVAIDPDSHSEANDINYDGSVIVGNTGANSFVQYGFAWTPEGGIQLLDSAPGISPSTTERPTASCVSSDGQTIGGAIITQHDTYPSYWDLNNAEYVQNNFPENPSGTITDVTADGSEFVGYELASSRFNYNGFILTKEAGRQNIDFNRFETISESGGIAAGSLLDNSQRTQQEIPSGANLKTGESKTYFDLKGDLLSVTSNNSRAGIVYDMTADGSLAVGRGKDRSYDRAVRPAGTSGNIRDSAAVWVGPLAYNLQRVLQEQGVEIPEGWELVEATGISDDGSVIVGEGYNPDGIREGFIITDFKMIKVQPHKVEEIRINGAGEVEIDVFHGNSDSEASLYLRTLDNNDLSPSWGFYNYVGVEAGSRTMLIDKTFSSEEAQRRFYVVEMQNRFPTR